MRNGRTQSHAIANATAKGIPLQGATLYTKMTPCYIRQCAQLIVASGITRIICERKYQNAKPSEEVFQKAGIEPT